MLSKLGKYKVNRELGRGAMGIVYEGYDPFIERAVAIKTIQKSMLDKSESDEILSRFRREAQAAGRLTHPNIVSVYEYGEDADVAFIAMEFIVGIELKEHFDKTMRFQIRDSAKIMTQLLEALEYSHSRGVVHRDIKPSNILITDDGQVKIADFGIAKIESSDLTQVGTVLGTPSYMSPEQFMGITADRRSDIYSAGVVLYQFLTGERPFSGSNMTVIMHKVLHQPPVLAGKLGADVPQGLQEVVAKAMSKRPEDRYQTAAEFLEDYKRAVESRVAAIRVSADEPTLKITRPTQLPQDTGMGQGANFDFIVTDFEERLRESQQEADRKLSALDMGGRTDNSLRDVNMEFRRFIASQESGTAEVAPPAPKPGFLTPSSAGLGESGLLAGLAREAGEVQSSRQSSFQEGQARARKVDNALNKIFLFFSSFIKHVNKVGPPVNRTYRFDARTIFANLRWQEAVIDYRKQNLSDAAYTDYVTLNITLCASEPVLLKRPWGPLETLKKELHHLRLRVIDDAGMSEKKSKKEWLEAQLAPDFPLQITFHGNYAENNIDVMCRNLESFDVVAYKLESDDVTSAFLDDLGLLLLGRSDKLPEQFRSV